MLESKTLFESIIDYKDATKRVQNVKDKYEDVLQSEKEQAILQKEAEEAERKKTIKKCALLYQLL